MEKKMLNVAYLNGATPIKNGTSGGGSSSGGGSAGGDSTGGGEAASTIEYLDLREVSTLIGGQIPLKSLVGMMGYCCKFTNPYNADVLVIAGMPLIVAEFSSYIATLDYHEVEINFDGVYGGNSNTKVIETNKDILIRMGVTQEQLDAIPRITKEQFYTI